MSLTDRYAEFNEMTLALAFDKALDAFLAGLAAKTAEHHALHYANLTPPKYTTERGPKYIRIVANDSAGSSRRVHSFIRISDGAVLMARGWKGPDTKHPRGSIFVNAGMDAVTPFGANYLK